MIVRVWGRVNNQDIEFEPVPDKPSYWYGYADGVPGLQDIEIWAENDEGARGHIHCEVSVQWLTQTKARLIVHPFVVRLLAVTHDRIDNLRIRGSEVRIDRSKELQEHALFDNDCDLRAGKRRGERVDWGSSDRASLRRPNDSSSLS